MIPDDGPIANSMVVQDFGDTINSFSHSTLCVCHPEKCELAG